jgi:hypothetical protein
MYSSRICSVNVDNEKVEPIFSELDAPSATCVVRELRPRAPRPIFLFAAGAAKREGSMTLIKA